MNWWQTYLATAATAAVLSTCLTFLCRRAGRHFGFVDQPFREAHKRHRQPIPVFGGVGMYLAWVGTVGLGLFGMHYLRTLMGAGVVRFLSGVPHVLPELAIISVGGGALVLLGLIDDRWSLPAGVKFAGQFLVAGSVALSGVRVTLFWQVPLVTWAITTLWILTLINAINFFDNMDGLAAGTVLIAAVLFGFVAAIRGQHFVAVLAAATAGSTLGFLVYNRPPASIFMGDAGSHFLGYLLAVLGALTTFYAPGEAPTPAPILIPLFVLGLPLFDLVAVVVMRLHYRKPVYVGDHTHISHRFEKMGLSRARAVLMVHLLTFTIGAGAVTLLWVPAIGAVVVFLQSVAVLTVVTFLQSYASEAREEESC